METKLSDGINENLIKIQKQNEIIINFLARLVLKSDQIKKIVSYKKSNPKKYIEGYNACDGKHSVKDLVNIVGVKQGTLSPILQEWEEEGIVYSIERGTSKYYKKYFRIK